MAKAKVLRNFIHKGKTYRAGDEFDGADAEIEALAGQGYIKRKDGGKPPESHAMATAPGSGIDVSASSSGNTGDSFQRTAFAAKIAAKLKRK
jgi:hypothetical protein